MTNRLLFAMTLLCMASLTGCTTTSPASHSAAGQHEAPEWFLLRPGVEKAYGYSHAVKIGDDIKISGAVSMDDEGNPTAVGDLEQQMKTPTRIWRRCCNTTGTRLTMSW